MVGLLSPMTPPLSSDSDADQVSSPQSTRPPASAVEALGETIAALAARLHAATYELLVLLREFDERAGWNNGFLSCAHWLQWRTGIDLGAAREKVRVAKALARLPRLSGAMQRGTISYAKVRAMSRIATPDNEAQLLDLAYAGTAAHVERVVRAWRRCDRVEEARDTARRHLSRTVTTYVDDDGMLVLRARLTPELGAVVQRALDAASERLYQESKDAASPTTVAEEVTAAQRRADGLGLLAECALQADLDRGSAADRHQVVLHVEATAVGASPSQAVIELGDGGVQVSAETSRRVACDASVVVMREGPDGAVLDVGRKTRTIPVAIRRALAARDARCRFPGCNSRRCDAHHMTHWCDGGRTSLDNLMLLCRRHHRLVHEGGFQAVQDRTGDVIFTSADGRRLEPSPPLQSTNENDLDHDIDARSLPCWDGTPFNLAYTMDVLRGLEPFGACAGSAPPLT
jgi:hypothetical protein